MPMDQLPRLQRWLAEQRGGGWERDGVVTLASTAGPALSLVVVLAGTPLADRGFPEIEEIPDGPGDTRTLTCWVDDEIWFGFADATQLARLLDVFLDWANGAAPRRT